MEGDEARIVRFLKNIQRNKLEMAEVSTVTSEDYVGEVGRTSELAMFCSFLHLEKAVSLLRDMRDDLKAV